VRIRIVLASPSDVLPERKVVALVVERLNRHFADQDVLLLLDEWENSATPGFHREGRQNRIDDALKIEQSDLFIGIMWKKFGTPVHDARSGTEHEFQVAYRAYLASDNDKPQIFFYFKDVPESELTKKELREYRKVKKFRDNFPEEGLWWPFKDETVFERELYDHLEKYVKFLVSPRPALAPQPVLTPETTKANSPVISDSDSKSLDKVQVPKEWATQGIRRIFHPTLRMPWRISFPTALLLLLVIAFGLYSFSKSRGLDGQFTGVIQKDSDASSPTITLYPHANVRGGDFDNKPPAIPPASGHVRVILAVLSPSKDSELYDVTLFDERSDFELVKMTGLPVRDQAISFTLNPEMLPKGRYRFMLSRDNALTGFYAFVIDR
jgi:hypothetical protein